MYFRMKCCTYYILSLHTWVVQTLKLGSLEVLSLLRYLGCKHRGMHHTAACLDLAAFRSCRAIFRHKACLGHWTQLQRLCLVLRLSTRHITWKLEWGDCHFAEFEILLTFWLLPWSYHCIGLISQSYLGAWKEITWCGRSCPCKQPAGIPAACRAPSQQHYNRWHGDKLLGIELFWHGLLPKWPSETQCLVSCENIQLLELSQDPISPHHDWLQ